MFLSCNKKLWSPFNILCTSLFFLFCSPGAYAHITFDLYRSNQVTADTLFTRLKPTIKKITVVYQQALFSGEQTDIRTATVPLQALIAEIKAEVKRMGHFSYVGFNISNNRADHFPHFTLDLVDANDPSRQFNFNAVPEQTLPDPDHLIAAWLEYEKVGQRLVLTEKSVYDRRKPCPAQQCSYGFQHEKLKKYAVLFNTLVPKNKEKLNAILKQDKDKTKRAAAANLLAHCQTAEESIHYLLPALYDAESEVRNSVMFVMSGIFRHFYPKNFPIEKVLPILDFPDFTSRSGALMMVFSLIKDPNYAAYIKRYAGKQIMTNLKMYEPYLNQSAHTILFLMSGKQYGARDYKAWENWLQAR